MIADGLTKRGASSEDLMKVLHTGRFELQGGWTLQRRTGFTVRTWLDMNRDNPEELNDSEVD